MYIPCRAQKKNTSHGNEVLLQDTTHLTQRSCYQRGSPCQDPAGNGATRKPPDHRKETQTAVVWSCLLFIRSGQNHLARHSERGKTRHAEKEVGRQHTEWTGLEFIKSQRAVENEEKWRKLVAKSSVVLQWPLQLMSTHAQPANITTNMSWYDFKFSSHPIKKEKKKKSVNVVIFQLQAQRSNWLGIVKQLLIWSVLDISLKKKKKYMRQEKEHTFRWFTFKIEGVGVSILWSGKLYHCRPE